MHRISRDALFLGSFDKCFKQAERIDLGLKIVVEHGLESRHFGIHDHDVGGNTVSSQRHPFISHCHGKIVYPVILQCFGYLHGPGSIAVGLDHAHQFGLGFHERPIVIQVFHHGTEIHFQRGFMHFFHQQFREPVETETPGPFQQNHLVAQGTEHIAPDKFLHASEKSFIGYRNLLTLSTDFRAYTNKLHHTALSCQVAHLLIKGSGLLAALENVAQDKCVPASLVVGATVHEVECDVERVDVGVVGVVDKRATMLPLFHLQAHGHLLYALHAPVEFVRRDTNAQRHNGANDGITNGSVINERDGIPIFLATFIYIGDSGSTLFLLYRLDKHGCMSVSD